MSRPRLLDLFCGAGGAAMGYHGAGFEVVGVDIKPQPNYPFEFVQMDALECVAELSEEGTWNANHGTLDEPVWTAADFDAIHASPPCQRWSTKTKNPEDHPDLIAPLRPLLEATGLPWVIENVPAAPLAGPILCGSGFGLGIRRHRRFETNWPLMVMPCAHGQQRRRFQVYDHGKWYLSCVLPVYGSGGGKSKEHWDEQMGIDWMTHEEIVESLPPAYTELIGHQLIQHLEAKAAA